MAAPRSRNARSTEDPLWGAVSVVAGGRSGSKRLFTPWPVRAAGMRYADWRFSQHYAAGGGAVVARGLLMPLVPGANRDPGAHVLPTRALRRAG